MEEEPVKIGKPVTYTSEWLKLHFPIKLPHYKTREVQTIKKFVMSDILPGIYSFDVRLPYELTVKEKLLAPEEQRMMLALKSMRIDAIVETPDELWVLEVTRGLELSYTGKLLGYAHLYRKLFKPTKEIKMGIVALEDNPLARSALEDMGVKIWFVKI